MPDAILRVEFEHASMLVACEVRCTHPKELREVKAYADVGLPVLEIFVNDLYGENGVVGQALSRRISGYGLSGNSKYFGREWLYHPKAKEAAISKLRLIVKPEDDNRIAGKTVYKGVRQRLVLTQSCSDLPGTYRIDQEENAVSAIAVNDTNCDINENDLGEVTDRVTESLKLELEHDEALPDESLVGKQESPSLFKRLVGFLFKRV